MNKYSNIQETNAQTQISMYLISISLSLSHRLWADSVIILTRREDLQQLQANRAICTSDWTSRSKNSLTLCVCMYERERKSESEGETERERGEEGRGRLRERQGVRPGYWDVILCPPPSTHTHTVSFHYLWAHNLPITSVISLSLSLSLSLLILPLILFSSSQTLNYLSKPPFFLERKTRDGIN